MVADKVTAFSPCASQQKFFDICQLRLSHSCWLPSPTRGAKAEFGKACFEPLRPDWLASRSVGRGAGAGDKSDSKASCSLDNPLTPTPLPQAGEGICSPCQKTFDHLLSPLSHHHLPSDYSAEMAVQRAGQSSMWITTTAEALYVRTQRRMANAIRGFLSFHRRSLFQYVLVMAPEVFGFAAAIDRKLHIGVYGMDGECLARVAKRRLVDVDGRLLHCIVAVARRKNSHWIKYQWSPPLSRARRW